MGRRVVAVDATAEHRDGRAARRERATVRLAVDAARHAADHDGAGGRSLRREEPCDRPPVPGAGAGTDNGDGRTVEELGRRVAPKPETARRIRDLGEQRWIAAVPTAYDADRHGLASPVGERYESASATCSGRTSADPASAATVRATRATRARPRPVSGTRSTALSRSSDAALGATRNAPDRSRRRAVDHARRERRPTTPRAAPPAPPPAAAASRRRGRSGRAARARPSRGRRRSLAGEHAQSSARVAPPTAGAEVHRRNESEPRREEPVPADARHRDDAVLEWLAQRLEHRARELRKLVEEKHASMGEADLSGPRHRPAADRSRPPMPRGAAPGRAAPGRARSPERACRRRSGCASPRGPPRASAAGGWTAAAARASSCPCPGGPARRRLCDPAAASSSALLPRSWPRTSARSGRSGGERGSVARDAGAISSSPRR